MCSRFLSNVKQAPYFPMFTDHVIIPFFYVKLQKVSTDCNIVMPTISFELKEENVGS